MINNRHYLYTNKDKSKFMSIWGKIVHRKHRHTFVYINCNFIYQLELCVWKMMVKSSWHNQDLPRKIGKWLYFDVEIFTNCLIGRKNVAAGESWCESRMVMNEFTDLLLLSARNCVQDNGIKFMPSTGYLCKNDVEILKIEFIHF